MEKIKAKWDRDEQFNGLLQLYSKDFGGFYDEHINDMLIELLQECMGDTVEKWIDYFIFELNFGRNSNNGMVQLADGSESDCIVIMTCIG